MGDCIFCNIADGEMDTDLIYEDDKIMAFEDINPKAPVHILLVPKKHISTLMDLENEDYSLVGDIYKIAAELAEEHGIAKEGFRIVSNCNEKGGQTVFHVHFHLLGGRQLKKMG